MIKKIYITSNHGYNGWLRDCKAMINLRLGGLVLDLAQDVRDGFPFDDADAVEVMKQLRHVGISAYAIDVSK